MNKRMTLTELLVEYDGGLWRMLGKVFTSDRTTARQKYAEKGTPQTTIIDVLSVARRANSALQM